MSKSEKRRKPRLDEERVRGIAATFEAEVGSANFEISGATLHRDDADEWHVFVVPVTAGIISIDGGDKLIMVNDQTGRARYYDEYVREINGQVHA